MAIIGTAMRKLVHLRFGVFKNHIPYIASIAKQSRLLKKFKN